MSDDEPAPADNEAPDNAVPDNNAAYGNALPDYTALDDSTLITRRWEIREQLEREPPNMADLVRVHHLMTTEVLRRTITLRKKAN